MKSRALLLAVSGAAAVVLVAVVVWLLRARGAETQTVRVSIWRAASPDQNEQDFAPNLERQLATVPRMTSQHLEITRLGVTARCTFEPKSEAERAENLAAVAEAYQDLYATVSEAPPEAPAIWIFSAKDLTKPLAAVGGVDVETCGDPKRTRLSVAIDTDKLKALLGGDIVELESAIGGPALGPLTGAADVAPEEVGNRVVRGDIRVKDVATVTRVPLPSRCQAYLHDGESLFAHRVSPRPGLTPDARAKIDGIARDAEATIVHEDEVIEARYAVDPNVSAEARRRTAADYAIRGKLTYGLDVVGARISFDGTGSLVVRKPASVAKLKGLVEETPDVAWSGVAGAHRLEITIRGDDRQALGKRAREVQQRVSTLDGVGASLTPAAEAVSTIVYDVDAKEAEARGIDVKALKLVASTLGKNAPATAGIFIEPRPLGQLYVQGAPLSAYVHMRQEPQPLRLFRADRRPARELVFEVENMGVEARVRQALGDSADVSVRTVPAF